MNTKLKGNLLLNADIITPEMPYAVFSDEVTRQTKKEIVLFINYGKDMLDIYEANRDNLHVVNVVDMLKKMEEVFNKFSYERFDARRDR